MHLQIKKKWVMLDLGLRDYNEVWDFQKKLVDLRANNEVPDILLFLEHFPVITLGKKGSLNDVFSTKLPIIQVERGGKATYHGPGQLVIYFIIDLLENALSIKSLLQFINTWLISSFRSIGIQSRAGTGAASGIWVQNDKKVASIGLSVRKNITSHGIAINVTTNLNHFQYLSPCGYSSDDMVSFNSIGYVNWTVNKVQNILIEQFRKITNKTLESDYKIISFLEALSS